MSERHFLGKAYLRRLEPRVYGLFRNLVLEYAGKDGKPVQEKLKVIGPLKVLREASESEHDRVVLRTYSADEDREIGLVEHE